MAVGLVIAIIVAAVLLFIAWCVGLTESVVAWMRKSSIGYRKDRALREIHSEGQAARDLIRAASRQYTQAGLDRWIQERRRRERIRKRTVIGLGASFLILIFIGGVLWAVSPTPSNAPSLDTVIADMAKGDCTNFIDNYQTDALPADPEIVPCSEDNATFKAAWIGTLPNNADSCPAQYSDLSFWTDSSGITVCMDREYHTGQCMQGSVDEGYSYSWYDEAVIACSLAPTAQYPYIVKIVRIYDMNNATCPGQSSTENSPDDANNLTLCIVLWSQYHAGSRN